MFAIQTGGEKGVDILSKLNSHYEDRIIEIKMNLKQTKLTDFFSKN